MKRRAVPRRSSCLTEALEPRRLFSSGIAVTYATSIADLSGLSTVSYNGTTLINESNSQQQFQIPRYYKLNSDGTYTAVAGTTFYNHTWNTATHTLTYFYTWGTVACQFTVVGTTRLNMAFTVSNLASSGITLGGVVIYPAYIHFPYTITPSDEQQIAGSPNPATPAWYPETSYGIDGPAVVPADYSNAPTDNGAVMDLVNDGPATEQMYTSLFTTNYTGSVAGEDYIIYVGTAPSDNLLNAQAASPETFTQPLEYTNTAPGQTSSFEVSLRFGAAGTATTALATDIEQQYAAAYPQQVNWPDTRPIASLHIASEGSSTSTDPNAWNFTSNINTTTTAGLNNFSSGLLSYAATSIAQMTTNHAQGMIVWDLEGEEYAQPNPTYLGDPSQLPIIAPEMEYNYQGNGPIVNQFFSAFSKAGFRVGVTLRPTAIQYVNGVPDQTPNDGIGSVPINQEIANLEAKISYAYSNWGCTLFYVDSTTGFDTAALRTVQAAYPNVLLIPEHQTTSTWGTAVAYGELTNDFIGTPASVEATYPTAKSLIYIADGDTSNYSSGLITALTHGDIMLFRGWFADPGDPVMRNDYLAAMPLPTQPVLRATPSSGSVGLLWSTQGHNAVYNLMRATSSAGPYSLLASGLFGNTYTDNSVTNGQTYYYTVTAVNGAGNSPASTAQGVTPAGPVVTAPASASSTTVTTNTTNLSVQATDADGASTLIYTWSETSTPSGAPAVSFSANGTNAAQNTTAQFYQAGTYVFTATITDPDGNSITSTVTVNVVQALAAINVLPAQVTIAQGGMLQYAVLATDQFSNPVSNPSVTWAVSGGGNISTGGLFTAGTSGGLFTVTATTAASGSVSTTVNVQKTAPNIQNAPLEGLPINIGDSDLILTNGGAAGLSQVQSDIVNGSITSSAAAADTSHLTTIGVILNNDGNSNALYTSFDGLPTSLNDVLTKYTYFGDANLDGKVDGSDYSRIDSGFLTHASGWYNGDFNNDGVINGSDYTLIDNGFNRQGINLGGASQPAVSSSVVAKTAARIAPTMFSTVPVSSGLAAIGTSDQSVSDLLDSLRKSRIGR